MNLGILSGARLGCCISHLLHTHSHEPLIFISGQQEQTMNHPRKIRWVLAHEPIELFVRAARKFSAEVNARAAGQLDIEVLTLSEYAAKCNGGKKVTKHDLLDLME